MQKNTSFKESFSCAWAGIRQAVRRERNLRFHLCITNLICVFAACYGLGRAEWAVLLLAIVAVLTAEFFNTALEQVADAVTEEYSAHVKFAKDAAAGAVLVTAIAAVGVGIALFLDIEKIKNTLVYIFTNWNILIPCIVLGIADILFLLFGGERKNYESK